MELQTLLENTVCQDGICCAHGLSLSIHAAGQHILFDMGPGTEFLENADVLGVDLTTVDFAVLSHGHYDHSGGLKAFLACNDHAPVYIRQGAFGTFYDGEGKFIGMDPALEAFSSRIIMVEGTVQIAPGISLFGEVEDTMDATRSSVALKERQDDGTLVPDVFRHEQNLLIHDQDHFVVIAGCAHRGVLNILAKAEALAGTHISALVGGFHLVPLAPEDPQTRPFLSQVAQGLLARPTQYYTGHCTGDYAFDYLKERLGSQLLRISGGFQCTL